MRRALCAALALGAAASPLAAQTRQLTSADSVLVGRMLLAEDRRDSTDAALKEGLEHADPRVSVIAHRAIGRIRDSLFVSRDSLPALPAPMVWPEPAWRLRYRALSTKSDCHTLGSSLADSSWIVRLRAADLLTAPCAGSSDKPVVVLVQWVDSLPASTPARKAGSVSWHAGAHAIVALAKLAPDSARARVARLAAHRQWEVRMYATRALVLLADTARLHQSIRDPNDNVKEVAIAGLSRLAGHDYDELYVTALSSDGAQAARAAARALKGSKKGYVMTAARTVLDHWQTRNVASARDVRLALLDLMGRPASDDHPPKPVYTLPHDAVALALGADIRLKVKMSPASGGGSFVVHLRGDIAPMTASRILALVRQQYYDRGNWHRVEADFVIQGAGPGTNEYVGYKDYFRDELGNVPHVRGTIGMSTRGHDTGDGQWFINLRDNLRLDPLYTVFAEVVEGMDVVDGILEGDTIDSISPVPYKSSM